MFKSNTNPAFRTQLAETIFSHKYKHQNAETWSQLCDTLVEHVMADRVPKEMNAHYEAYFSS